jgi:hypothetical protein
VRALLKDFASLLSEEGGDLIGRVVLPGKPYGSEKGELGNVRYERP